MRILIIEDDSQTQLGIQKALADYPDLEIVGLFEDGCVGFRAALNLQPDLIIMGIGLPCLDGIEATKKIKEALPQVRVVILTSHTLPTEVIAALSSGADAYCIKGKNVDRLLAAIAAAKEGAVYLDPQIARTVLDNLKSPVTPQHFDKLSAREMEVLRLIVQGKTNTEIAAKLYLSPNTVKTHVRGIMNKLAVDDRVQAAVVALRSGLV